MAKNKSKKNSKSPADAWYDFVSPIDYPREVNNNMNIHKLASVGSLLAFAAAALGNVVFGYSGLELVAAGLFLHAGADLIEDVLS